MVCLHHLLKKAVEWEMVEESPFDKGNRLLVKENNKRLRYLARAEIPKLLSACTKHLRPVVECALHTGMRKGEIRTLKWSQIKNGFIYLEKTKTDESRQVPINDDLERLFKEIRKEQGLSSEYVFIMPANSNGQKGHLKVVSEHVGTFKTAFPSAVRRAGIKDFTFHDLRHTFASHMIMKGASLKEVQEILGHKTMQMTMRYAHLSQEHKKKAVNLLNGLTTNYDETTGHKFSSRLVTR